MWWLEPNAECLTSKGDSLMPWVDGPGARGWNFNRPAAIAMSIPPRSRLSCASMS